MWLGSNGTKLRWPPLLIRIATETTTRITISNAKNRPASFVETPTPRTVMTVAAEVSTTDRMIHGIFQPKQYFSTSDRKPPEIANTEEIAIMYPAPTSIALVTALVPPKVLPTKAMNPPVDGCALENWASLLPRNAIAMPATRMVRGAATPAVKTRNPKPKKKL